MSDAMDITARCHCGTVVLQAHLPRGLGDVSRCTCSFCARRQAGAVMATASTVKVLEGEGNLTLYTWGTHTAQHYFCKICGIYTHHQRRSDPSECGINIGCIDGVNTWEHEPIRWTDGVNHPSDQ